MTLASAEMRVGDCLRDCSTASSRCSTFPLGEVAAPDGMLVGDGMTEGAGGLGIDGVRGVA